MSNFTFEVIRTIKTDDKKYIILDIKTKFKTYSDVKFTSEYFVKLDNFHKVLKKVDETLTIDNYKALSKAIEFSKDIFNTKEVQGTNKTGFHENLFVTTKATYNEKGEIVDNLIYIYDLEYIKTNIFKNNILSNYDMSKEFIKSLLTYNTPEKCIAILGYCMACFRQEDIIKSGYKLPILTIIGEAGAGKTTTVDTIVKNIFSTDTILDAGGSTKFTFLKNSHSSNCIPLILDEYKPSKMPLFQINMLSEMIRNSYDNAKMQRGQSNQSIQSFTLTAPLIIIGENCTDENALTERAIFLDFFKKDVEQIKTATESMRFLKRNKKLLKKLGRTMQKWVANNPINTKVISNNLEIIESKSNIEIDRIRASQSILIYCYNDFLTMLKNMYGVDMIRQFDCDNATKHLNDMIIKNLGGTKIKSELDKTIGVINNMIDFGVLTKDYDYMIAKGEIRFNVNRVFIKMGKFINEYKINESILDEKLFTKNISKQSYYKDYRTVKMKKTDCEKSEKKVMKCYVLDINILQKTVEGLEFINNVDELESIINKKEYKIPESFLQSIL